MEECDLITENKTTHKQARAQGFRVIDYPNSFIVEWDSEHRLSSGQLDSRGYNKRPDNMAFIRQRDKGTGQIVYYVAADDISSLYFNCSY